MNWFTQQRQNWIAETVSIFGFIQREHIVRKFGVSVPQASMDLSEFRKRNPRALRYDTSAKRYVTVALPALKSKPLRIRPPALNSTWNRERVNKIEASAMARR